MKRTKVLFVCLGNICRSPTAEGVFRAVVEKEGLSDFVEIDSAGTSDWHVGRGPDERTVRAAASRGYDLSSLRGRQAEAADFAKFDFVLAMDSSNLNDLKQLKPDGYSGYLGLFLDFAQSFELADVPDPYYGGEEGFNFVLDLVEDACRGLLRHIKSR